VSIFKNLKRMHAAVVAQQVNGESALGAALNNAAVKAVLGGMGSDAWKSYMAVFADNADQLSRLTQVRQTPPELPWVSQMRAYIVSNAICDITTNAFLNNRVGPEIDGGHGTTDADISDAINDPGGTIANLRPQDLKSIPDVTV
jgi:hypothetical protein